MLDAPRPHRSPDHRLLRRRQHAAAWRERLPRSASGAFRRGSSPCATSLVFAWHQARFLAVGENSEHLVHHQATARSELIGGHTEDELRELADEIYERDCRAEALAGDGRARAGAPRKGHEVWLISATPQIVAEVIAERLGLTGALGTRVEPVDGDLHRQARSATCCTASAKAVAPQELAHEQAGPAGDCWAYTDSPQRHPAADPGRQPGRREPGREPRPHAEAHATGRCWNSSRRASARPDAGAPGGARDE